MRYTTGTLADLNTCVNAAIIELGASIVPANGTLSRVTSRLNELLVWYESIQPEADGTLASAVTIYNLFASDVGLTQLLPRQSRDPGTITTPAVAVPSGSYTVRLVLDIVPQSSFSSPTQKLTFYFDVSTDGGTNWKYLGGGIFTGGARRTEYGGVWWIQIGPVDIYSGNQLRARLTQEGVINYGIRGDFR